MAGRLAVQAGMGAFKAARGLFRKDTTAADVDQPGTDKGLAKESKKSPGGTTRKMGMVDQTHIDDGLSPMDVPSGTTLHHSPQIKTALTDYANALGGTYDQLHHAQKQLNKKAPDFAQAERDVEAMANDMLGKDLRHLQAGLGLDKDTLHSWLISPTRSSDADPVIALKSHLTIELKEAGHSAPQSEAMAAWLFDQIMVAGSVCLTAQSSGDTARFKTYLQASVDHLQQAHHGIKDDAAVGRLMDRWAAGQMDQARADERELIRALIRQAADSATTPTPTPRRDQRNTTILLRGEADAMLLGGSASQPDVSGSADGSIEASEDHPYIAELLNTRDTWKAKTKPTDGAQQSGQPSGEDEITPAGSVHVPDKKTPGLSEQIKDLPLSAPDKSMGTKAPEKQGEPSKEKTSADSIGSVYPRVMDTAAERLRKALQDAADKEVVYLVKKKEPGREPSSKGKAKGKDKQSKEKTITSGKVSTYANGVLTLTPHDLRSIKAHMAGLGGISSKEWSELEIDQFKNLLMGLQGDPFNLSRPGEADWVRGDALHDNIDEVVLGFKRAIEEETRKAAQ